MNCKELTKALAEHHAALYKLHEQATALLIEVEPLTKGRTELGELVDLGIVLREVERMHDELRKDAAAHKEVIGKVIAFRKITATMNDEDPDLRVRGDLGSGMPNVRFRTKVPKRGTPEYVAMCKSFGMGQEIIDSGVFQAHYVHMGEYASDLVEAGLNLPPGVELSAPIYTTTFRRKK